MNKGFLIIEIILSVAVFIMILLFAYSGLSAAGQGAYATLSFNKASSLAKEGLEASYNAREDNYAQFTDGNYGIYHDGNKWFLSPSPNVIDNIYTRNVTLTTITADKKSVVSTVSWSNPFSSSTNTLSYSTYVTNWATNIGSVCLNQKNYFVFDSSQVSLANSGRDIIGTRIKNTSLSCNLVLDKIKVTWSSNKKIQEISIGGSYAWASGGPASPNGSQNSGTDLDIINYTLNYGNTFIAIDRFDFNGAMNGNTITVTFTFSDNTNAIYSFII